MLHLSLLKLRELISNFLRFIVRNFLGFNIIRGNLCKNFLFRNNLINLSWLFTSVSIKSICLFFLFGWLIKLNHVIFMLKYSYFLFFWFNDISFGLHRGLINFFLLLFFISSSTNVQQYSEKKENRQHNYQNNHSWWILIFLSFSNIFSLIIIFLIYWKLFRRNNMNNKDLV